MYLIFIMEILAIIPARGSSKGIKNKNIREFCGKPLIAYTIEQSLASRFITRTIVSTDSQNIADITLQYGAEVPFLRPKELAMDKSQVADSIIHALDFLKESEQYEPDYIVMLQATSPLRTVTDIDSTLALLFEQKAEAAVTLCKSEQLLYIKDDRQRLKLVSPEFFLHSTNRQDNNETYILNGAMVYASQTSAFRRNRSFLKGDMIGLVVDKWRSIDLDDPADFVLAELAFNNLSGLQTKVADFN